MKSLPIDQVQIAPNRQRREFNLEKLNSLREDIEQNGLFHAPVLRNDGSGGFILVSGERRLRAIRDLHDLGGQLRYDMVVIPAGHLPYVELGDLNPLDAELAELSENLARADLTWQEAAAATARIQRLRTELATRAGESAPTLAEISTEVRGSAEGYNHEATRREIIVAQHLDRPEIRAAKSTDEAFKLLRREEEKAKNVALAATVGRSFSSASHTVLNEDSIGWMAGCSEGQFDIILTDPPYGMGADGFGDSGEAGRRYGVAEHDYKDDLENFKQLISGFRAQSLRLTKPEAHLYMFCDLDQFHYLRGEMEATGWWVHRTPLIWTKPNALRVPWPEHGPRRSYELILYAVKGKRTVNFIGSDVIEAKQDTNLGHSAQKPVGLLVELLKRSARPGDRVLDPFAGTGSILPAAHEVKCLATAIERDPGHYGIMLKRLEGLE